MKEKIVTREDWLNAAVTALRPMIETKGRKIPPVRVSTGWPHKGGLSDKGSRNVGECWDPDCSEDKTTEIFISPWLSKAFDPENDGADGVLATLLHELIHAAVGVECGHKGEFKALAVAVGFEAPMTSTPCGDVLKERLEGIAEAMGPYPHARLDRSKDKKKKKQTTRMIKCECLKDECGFTVRMARKWLDELGPAHCPKHGALDYELPPELDGERDIETESE